MSSALDTSVIVAALLAWHEAHDACLEAIADAAGRGGLVLPGSALVEAYAVMTRLPAPHRLAPAVALELLSGSFQRRAKLVVLTPEQTWALLHDAPDRRVAGGAVYDAQIVRAAAQAGATQLLTLDRDDFERLSPDGIEIVVPGA